MTSGCAPSRPKAWTFNSLPGVEVLAVLERRGVNVAGWPADAHEVLRSPQALATYLQLGESQRSEPLSSYHSMLDRLWAERVLRTPNGVACSQLAGTIADTMAEEESLWLARAHFDDQHNDIEALIGAGILTLNVSGLSIGFAHQTVFDYALARAFSQERGRLSSYVLERQSSIFIRPKVWAALTYLRATDANTYNEELRTVWGTRGLRRHLRRLLIDFLGQQAEPSDGETLLMEQALEAPEERAIAYRAMSGSAGWFRRFVRSYFADAMSAGSPAADWMVDTLITAWSSDPKGVTSLLRERWLPDTGNDARVWTVIQQAPTWTEELLEIGETVLRRSEIAATFLNHVVAEVGVEQPEIALKLLRAGLERELSSAEAAAIEKATEAELVDSSVKETTSWSWLNDPGDAIKRIIGRNSNWGLDPCPS